MRSLSLAALLLLAVALLAPSARAQSAADSARVEEPALRKELLKMEERDQQMRRSLMEAGQRPDSAAVARLRAADSTHTERMKEIIEQHGWPDYDLVGKDGARAAFLLVQHSPDWDFQERMLALLREAYERGKAEGQWVGLLTDRVRVHNGKPQLYGTQLKGMKNGNVTFHTIKDSARVDERREKMDMIPLREYIQILKEAYSEQSDS